MQKLAFVFLCVLSLTVSAKTEIEMCKEMARKNVTLHVLADAPLGANPQILNYRVEQALSFVTRDQYEKCSARVTKEEYQCMMDAKTTEAVEGCNEKARWALLIATKKPEMKMCQEQNRKLIALTKGVEPSGVRLREVNVMMGLNGYERCVARVTKEEYQCMMDAKTTEAVEGCKKKFPTKRSGR